MMDRCHERFLLNNCRKLVSFQLITDPPMPSASSRFSITRRGSGYDRSLEHSSQAQHDDNVYNVSLAMKRCYSMYCMQADWFILLYDKRNRAMF